ncbi:acetaldehyde dehydrogenase (acetylating) [Blautia schinkii]|nr:acetaldehyde dehydrogenase (acetylating) [Blautia schinkii]
MELKDKDLLSVQEARDLLAKAKAAQQELAGMDQQQIDRIVKAISEAGIANAETLAKDAQEETGFGKWQDKVLKNLFAAKTVYEAVKDQKTIGLLREDKENKVWDIGVPVGVIAGIVPSTNPTSTVIYKAMIALKSGNAIVFSPHPGAKNCIVRTVKIIAEAAEKAGCPKGAISVVTIPTMQATKELMGNANTALILATGGGAMVKSAYSSGTPAIGVGAGNGPAFIDKSADVPRAVKQILDSKTFDNGTICASEQSIVVEKSMEDTVVRELKNQGAVLLDESQSAKLAQFILRANGTMNPMIVGKTCAQIAQYAGLSGIPKDARVLVAKADKVGEKEPYSREKLAPILGLFVERDTEAVLKRCVEILYMEGAGHTFSMHAKDENLIRRFALAIPASRFLVNTAGSLGGIGATTRLFPALTLGCGAVGGSSSSNNIGPMDLINIKRVAFGTKELDELRREAGVCGEYGAHTGGACWTDADRRTMGSQYAGSRVTSSYSMSSQTAGGSYAAHSGVSKETIDSIVDRILKELL